MLVLFQPRCIYASNAQNINSTEIGSTNHEEVGKTVSAFVELSWESSHINIEKKIPLNELITRFPKTINALDEKDKMISVEVEWECISDYAEECLGEYMFNPIFKEDVFLLESVNLFDIPSIYVFVDEDVLFEDSANIVLNSRTSSPNHNIYDDLILAYSKGIDDDIAASDFELWLANYFDQGDDYYMNRYKGIYRQFVENLNEDSSFQNQLGAYRTLTFDLSSEAKYSQKEVAACQAILFDVLYQSDTSNIFDKINNTYKKLGISGWKKLAELDSSITKELVVEPDNIELLGKHLTRIDTFSSVLKRIDNIGDFISTCTTAQEVMEKFSKAQALSEMSEEVAILLYDMSDHTDNLALRYALREFSTICSGSLNSDQLALLFSSESATGEIAKLIFKEAWTGVTSICGSVGLMIQAGQGIGKFGSNLFFGTDKIIDTYYTLKTLYNFEDALKSQIREYKKDFEKNMDITSARKYSTSMIVLGRLHQVGIDYAIKFNDAVYKSGMVNVIYKALDKEEYDKYNADCKFIQKIIKDYFNNAGEIAYNGFVDYNEELHADDVIVVPIDDYDEVIAEDPEKIIIPNITVLDYQDKLEENTEVTSHYVDYIIDSDVILEGDFDTLGDLIINPRCTLDLNGYMLRIGGNGVIQGNVKLNGGELKVTGDVEHIRGTIFFENGIFDIKGNYTKQFNDVNVMWDEDCSISMKDNRDTFIVHGDAESIINTSEGYSYSKPKDVYLNGNIYLYGAVPEWFGGNSISENCIVTMEGNNHIINGDFGTVKLLKETVTVNNKFSAKKMLSDISINCTNDISLTIENLNGYNLNVDGNIKQLKIDLDNGKANFHGDVDDFTKKYSYSFIKNGSANISGNFGGKLYMTSPENIICIDGNASFSYAELLSGQLILKGNVSLEDVSTKSNIEHLTVLDGSNYQEVNLAETFEKIASFGTLEIKNNNALCHKLAFKSLKSDAQCLVDNSIIRGIDLGGKKLDLIGDVTLTSSVNVNHGELNIYGNVFTTDFNGHVCDLDINSGYVGVYGDLHHSDGRIFINKGELYIDEDYLNNNDYVGNFEMANENDIFRVHGNTYITSNRNSLCWEAGTTYFEGSLIETSDADPDTAIETGNAYGGGIHCGVNHKTVFNGSDEQIISLLSVSNEYTTWYCKSYLGTVLFDNDKIIIEGIGLTRLDSDLVFKSKGGKIWSPNNISMNGKHTGNGVLDLNKHIVEVTGDIVLIGDVDINSGKFKVNGDVIFRSDININKGIIDINGNVNHYYGQILFNEGQFKVNKNYDALEYQNPTAHACVTMNNKEDYFCVGENINIICPQHSPIWNLSAGILEVKGNCKIDYSHFGYTCNPFSGSNRVILSGENKQTIIFDYGDHRGNYFNELQISHNLSNYEFDPNPCWNILIGYEDDIKDESHDLTDASITILTSRLEYSASINKVKIENVVVRGKDGSILNYGSDYIISYPDLDYSHPGRKTISVEGINNYYGSKSASYDIVCNLNNHLVNVSPINNEYEYTGQEIKPQISLSCFDVGLLQEDINYVLKYDNNVNVGIAVITISSIEGPNNYYYGDRKVLFNIVDSDESGEIKTQFISYIVVNQKIDITPYFDQSYGKYAINPKNSAVITNKGLVTAKKPGEITITGYIKSGKKWVVDNVNAIKIKVEKPVFINKTINATKTGKSIFGIDNIENCTITPTLWTSSNKKVALVDEKNGLISTVGKGSTKITAVYGEGKNAAKYSFTVKVNIPVISKKSLTMITGKQQKVKLNNTKLAPTWRSSNESVAVVENGVITATGYGEAMISAVLDGVSYTCQVSVKKPEMKKSEYTVRVGRKITVGMKNMSLKSVDWKSENEGIAVVDSTGLVYGILPGTVTIYTNTGGVYNSCQVTVKP